MHWREIFDWITESPRNLLIAAVVATGCVLAIYFLLKLILIIVSGFLGALIVIGLLWMVIRSNFPRRRRP